MAYVEGRSVSAEHEQGLASSSAWLARLRQPTSPIWPPLACLVAASAVAYAAAAAGSPSGSSGLHTLYGACERQLAFC